MPYASRKDSAARNDERAGTRVDGEHHLLPPTKVAKAVKRIDASLHQSFPIACPFASLSPHGAKTERVQFRRALERRTRRRTHDHPPRSPRAIDT
jgi:hypothetical protein